jgi:hypothetical protein
MNSKTWIFTALVAAAVAVNGYVYWQQQMASRLPDGIVSSNDLIEAGHIKYQSFLDRRRPERLRPAPLAGRFQFV